MKKKLLTLLLAVTLTAGSFTTAIPAYAQEENVTEDAAAFGSSLDEVNSYIDTDEEGASQDASLSASMEASEEQEISEEETVITDEEKEISEEETVITDETKEAKENEETEEAASASEASSEEDSDASSEGSSEETSVEPKEDSSDAASSEESAAEPEDIEDKLLLERKYVIKDGYDPDKHCAFRNGKLITGWICAKYVNGGNYEILATGSKALSTTGETAYVYYIDPGTKTAVYGMTVIGGKKYLFDAMSRQLRRGEDDRKILPANDGTTHLYMVKPSGEIYTGWQNILGKDVYLDPSTGIMAMNKWAPKGKGVTYLNDDGLMADTLGNAITTGMYYIEGEYYFFKAGIRTSGIIYFDDKNEVTTAAKASYARFFDAAAGALKSGYFNAGGKYYFAGDYDLYDAGAKGNKLDLGMDYGRIELDSLQRGYIDDSYSYFYIQKSGALLTNKLFTHKGKKHYAKADGKLCRDEYMLIGGKWCYFDRNCMMISNGGDAEGKATDYYSYVDGADSVSSAKVYIKNRSAKDDGVLFYADKACTQKLTNCWLVTTQNVINVQLNRKYYLDKNGNPVKGLVTIGSSKYLFDSKTCLIKSFAYKENDLYIYKVLKISGKNYLLGTYGEIITKEGFVYVGSKTAYYVKKDGTAAVGMTTINGRKYYFDSEGKLVYDNLLSVNGKVYQLNAGYEIGKAADCYILEKKDYPAELFPKMMVNSDGSLYTGWKTYKGKKYFYEAGESAGYSYGYSSTKKVYEIGGKLYSFSAEGYALTGMFTIEPGTMFDIIALFKLDSEWGTAKNTLTYYFDPKTCAAVTGFRKINNKTYYFRPTAGSGSQEYKGTMVRGTTLMINGKNYMFDNDGVLVDQISSGKKQMTDAGTKVSYYLSPRTGEIERCAVRKTGNKWFYYNEGGMQCAELTTKNMDNENITARFSKDGSIQGFYAGDVKQTNIMIGGDDNLEGYYFLDAKGMPMTGFFRVSDAVSMEIAGTPNARVYVESDGYCARTHNPLLQYGTLIKSGNKIYALINGTTVTDTDKKCYIMDYSRLPASDRNTLDQYIKMHQLYESSFSDVYEGEIRGRLYCFTNSDGTLAAGQTRLVYGKTVHLNKYGIPKEDLGMFVKEGKDWYLSSKVSAKGKIVGIKLEAVLFDRSSGDEVEIKVGSDGKLSQAINLRTGKPLDGFFEIDGIELKVESSDDSVQTGTMPCYNMFKKGYPIGKKYSFKYGGFTGVCNVDPDTGWSLELPDIKLN